MTANGSHIGAVGDLERKTSDYQYTLLDVLPFNLSLKPPIALICCYRLMRFNYPNFNTKHESSFYFLGWEEKYFKKVLEIRNIIVTLSYNNFKQITK